MKKDLRDKLLFIIAINILIALVLQIPFEGISYIKDCIKIHTILTILLSFSVFIISPIMRKIKNHE